MATESTESHGDPSWFVAPGEIDHYSWVSFVFICLALYGLVTLYAMFDKWAEHQSQGTPLARTIPTMLTIALLYEIFPLSHFNILLPIAAILIALMADWSRFHWPGVKSRESDADTHSADREHTENKSVAVPSTPLTGVEQSHV